MTKKVPIGRGVSGGRGAKEAPPKSRKSRIIFKRVNKIPERDKRGNKISFQNIECGKKSGSWYYIYYIPTPVPRRLLDKGGQLGEADHLPIILLSHVSGVWALVQEGAVAPSLLVNPRILADIRNIIGQGHEQFSL